jgi:hypothetical protein
MGDKWRALVNAIMNLWVPWNAGKFLSGVTTGGLSSSAQLHKLSYFSLVVGFYYQFCHILLMAILLGAFLILLCLCVCIAFHLVVWVLNELQGLLRVPDAVWLHYRYSSQHQLVLYQFLSVRQHYPQQIRWKGLNMWPWWRLTLGSCIPRISTLGRLHSGM